MTSVIIIKENNIITDIEIKGHAMSASYGKDLVCAGISTVVTGICNALVELTKYDEDQITFNEGLVAIPNIINNDKMQLICQVMIVQLKTIEQLYPKYIEISYK